MNNRTKPGGPRAAAFAVVVFVSLLAADPAAGAVTCGKERWPVKTGTDADVNQVDVAQSLPTSIVQMRALTAPSQRPQDHRVAPTETTVYSMTAFITHYKREPDSDYHLVISDTDGMTMVAEIPHPDCVRGPSKLSTSIAQARSAFDATLHASRKFQELNPPLRVELRGVGFFDTPSHGKGAPANGIELHPVLDLVFVPTSPPPTGGRQLLADPSFENPSVGAWNASDGVITDSTKRTSHVGKRYAWLGGYGRAHTDTLWQEVTLPSAATRITLSFWLAIDTKERSTKDEYDALAVDLRSSGGTRLATLGEYSNLDAVETYQRRNFDLTPYRGQTVVLWLAAEEDGSLQTSFLLDDFTLDAQ